MVRGNSTNVALGPGLLRIAPLLTAIPANLDEAWAAAWTPVGYTMEGSTQSYSPSYEDVEVAEELDPIDSRATGRQMTVSFGFAELTARNYQAAMNGGTVVFTPAGVGPPVTRAFTTFEPPQLGAETLRMIGFESEDGLERIVWKQCKQVGSVETMRRKGAEKAGIPAEFRAYVPSDGSKPFIRLSGRGSDGVA